jgi:fumarate hydratase subunit beta
MTSRAIHLHTPLGKEVLDLHAGDHVELSGIVYTARDEAHIRMQAEGIPFEPKGAVIYHCGPVVKDNRIIAGRNRFMVIFYKNTGIG